MKPRTLALVALATGTALALSACTTGDPSTTNDNKQTNQQLQRYQANQPVPKSDFSEYRQTVIDVQLAQIHGVATTTFFYNQGVQQPFKVCPSIGYPVASTSQLTDPQQIGFRTTPGGSSYEPGVINQAEPNGTYTGDSSGTYVVCVAPNGTKYITYWEGFVDTEGGAAHYDNTTHQIVIDTQTVKSTGKAATK